ncbi:DNA primase family protein [Yinghuangia aomiensis]
MTTAANSGFNPATVAAQLTFPSPTQPAPASQQNAVPAQPVLEGLVTGDGLIPDSLTDRGNAKLFVSLYGGDFKYVPGLGWYRWNGHRWEPDDVETVVWNAGEMAERIATVDAAGIHSREALRKHRRRAMSTSGVKAMLAQAKTAPGMAIKADQLDADPYQLCTPGGIVDLHTGAVAPADPTRHLHSRSTLVAPRAMPTPRWDRFLADTFGDDTDGQETIRFVHRLLGYSITGDVGAQVLTFLYGTGKNGKSVLLDTMIKLMGDYADAAPPGFLMAKNFDGHPTDLAELHGRRIIVCSEFNPEDRFDEARVKSLTGGDKLKARRMRQDFFSFVPTHKLWLLGNHKPAVTSGGFAFWRRIRLIPFERVVPDTRKVDNLADVLVQEEGPGILAWLVTGAGLYLGSDRDLTGPERVRLATTAYAETEDHLGRFLGECCKLDPDMRAEQATLFTAYRDWCQADGSTPVSNRAFAARVRETLGMASAKQMLLSNQRKYYPGIGLLDTAEEPA